MYIACTKSCRVKSCTFDWLPLRIGCLFYVETCLDLSTHNNATTTRAHCEGFPPLARLEVRRRTRLGTVSQNLWGKGARACAPALPAEHFDVLTPPWRTMDVAPASPQRARSTRAEVIDCAICAAPMRDPSIGGAWYAQHAPRRHVHGALPQPTSARLVPVPLVW